MGPCPEFRCIPTRRGIYFVPWQREALLAWLESESPSPEDFGSMPRSELRQLARDLLLMGVADEMASGDNVDSGLCRLARGLHRLMAGAAPQAA